MNHPKRTSRYAPTSLLACASAAALLMLVLATAGCGEDTSAGAPTGQMGDPGGAMDASGDNSANNTSEGDAGSGDGADVAQDADTSEDASSGDARVADDAAEGDASDGVDVSAPDATADAPVEEACAAGWSESFGALTELEVGESFAGAFERCVSLSYFVVAAKDQELLLELSGVPVGTFVEVVGLDGAVLATAFADSPVLSVPWTMTRSGEVRVLLRRPDGETAPDFTGLLTCGAMCDQESTRYPIVLMHGMAGTDSYFGVLEYFFEIGALYEERGYLSYKTVSQFIGHSEARAPIIAEQIDMFLAEAGVEKVHLIGHSQGGLDMRVLVSGLGYGDRVASMTTYATPHGGIKLELPAFLTGMDFSESYLKGEFTEMYPDVEEIPRFSWAGNTCGRLEPECQAELNGERVDLILGTTYHLVRGAHREDSFGGDNDGLVPVESAMWGEFLGTVPADHFDQVGQVADRNNAAFDHREFFLQEARRLRVLERDEGL